MLTILVVPYVLAGTQLLMLSTSSSSKHVTSTLHIGSTMPMSLAKCVNAVKLFNLTLSEYQRPLLMLLLHLMLLPLLSSASSAVDNHHSHMTYK